MDREKKNEPCRCFIKDNLGGKEYCNANHPADAKKNTPIFWVRMIVTCAASEECCMIGTVKNHYEMSLDDQWVKKYLPIEPKGMTGNEVLMKFFGLSDIEQLNTIKGLIKDEAYDTYVIVKPTDDRVFLTATVSTRRTSGPS